MHPSLVNRVIFPLHEWLKGKPTHARLKEIERTQWLDPEALRELQFRRLRRHLEFAYREVPYYTRLLDEHELQPSRVKDFTDFARIPFLTKEIMRKHFQDLQPRTALRGVKRMSTGGSTGVPVTFLVDPERNAFTDAARLRVHRWYNVDMGAREIVLWGSSIELTRQDIVRKIRDRLVNSRLLSAFDLGEASMARYAKLLRRDRPQKLHGYSSALYLFASYLNQRGWSPEPGWPRVAFATAEPLFDFQRTMIQSTFGCPVAVEYGSREAGLVADECPSRNLHIHAEGMVVEIAQTGNGGGSGELIVTNLDSYAMPIIRYRTGDIGVLDDSHCRCGRGLPLLRSIEGRRTDFLVTPDGKVMHALAVIYILREVSSIREFQVLQERLDHLNVTIVPDGGFSPAISAKITAQLERLFEGRVSVDIELVESIARPVSGKHRYVISQVADEFLKQLISTPGKRT